MEIKKIIDNKDDFMDLLLLGDEQENMIKRYLYIGDLFALYDDDLKTVCVVTKEDNETYEIKNLATYEKYHGKGYGTYMLKFIIEEFNNKCKKLILGTGDIDAILSYYKKFGFVYSHTIKNFFVDNYDHAMFEDGKQLVDMIYLKLEYDYKFVELSIESNEIGDYLKSSEIINFDDQLVIELAEEICKAIPDEIGKIKAIFKYVRDKIAHSADVNGTMLTCNASEVLKYGEGICYAKSHLLAALLRYHGIATGFCYQRLLSDDKQKFIIHGLNGVYIRSLDRWIRLDARGNKPGINSEFSIDVEKLAFQVDKSQGEKDILIVYREPDKNAVNSLRKYDTASELLKNLPNNLSCFNK